MQKAATQLNKMLATMAILLICQLAFSQSKHEKWELGLFLGASQGQTDLQNVDLKEQNFGFGGIVRYHFTDNLGLRLQAKQGKLTGDDKNYDNLAQRGFNYESPVTHLGLMGEWDLLGKRRYRNGSFHRIVSPYVFGGVGYGITDPTTNYNETTTSASAANINADKAKGAVKSHVSIPLGAGLKFDLSKRVALNLEATSNRLFGDYLDGVSQTGDPDNNDAYSFVGAVLSFRLNGEKDSDGDGIPDAKDACPEAKGTTEMMGCPDRDGDGVADKDDTCPDAKGLKSLAGCPDRDGDGVADAQDECPDNKGAKAFNGCPDTDGDGVVDKSDNCPNEKGLAAFNGCPDTDGDGVADKDDNCPKDKGTKENKGCPAVADRDGDGIADKDDACPDVKGVAKYKGCADTDGDGIEDPKDKCPNTFGLATNQGCPEIKAEDKKILEAAIYGVVFDPSKSTFKQESYAILNNVVDVMKRYPEYAMNIAGHTDSDGNDASNQKLSEARAKACYDYFVSKGIDAKRMTHAGYGETKPVGSNATAAGKAKNRRVEFELTPR